MKNAIIGVTKYQGQFTDPQGQQVIYHYLEFEVAPNVFAKLSLKESNMRVIQKYAPDMFQLINNVPLGTQLVFREVQPSSPVHNTINEIYSGMETTAENEL